MKREKCRTLLTAAALAFFTAWGATGCLRTAFDLNLEHPAFLLLVCALTASVCAVLFSFRYGGTVLLCLTALATGSIY